MPKGFTLLGIVNATYCLTIETSRYASTFRLKCFHQVATTLVDGCAFAATILLCRHRGDAVGQRGPSNSTLSAPESLSGTASATQGKETVDRYEKKCAAAPGPERTRPRPRSRNVPKLWSPPHVAAQLDVTVALVRGLIRKGELQAVSLGHRTLRVTEHSLKAYLKKIGA